MNDDWKYWYNRAYDAWQHRECQEAAEIAVMDDDRASADSWLDTLADIHALPEVQS